MTLLNKIRHRLTWKLFLSHLMVAIIGGAALVVIAQIFVSPAMTRHIETVDSTINGDPTLKQEIQESFVVATNEVLLVAMAAAFVAAFVFSSYVAQRIVVPIQQMMRASQRIAAGKYHERVPVVGKDELAELAHAFNRMVSTVEESEQSRLELIGIVAHELRTPLGSLQVLMEGIVDGVFPVQQATYTDFQRELKRLHRLVDDLQELSRIEAGQIVLTLKLEDIRILVQAVAELMRPQFDDKAVQLQLDLGKDTPPVKVDADRMKQVLVNLIGNALFFTPSGGWVSVRIDLQGNDVYIHVQDTGIGIAVEHLPHIFERFYRVDKSRSRVGGGSGIGLTIVKWLIEAHNGTISVTSAGVNQGTTFTVTIPRS